MDTSPKNDYSRRSNTMTYVLTAIGCGLILYGTIDFHFFSKRMRAKMEQMTHDLKKEVEPLNTETQRVNAEEK